MNTLDEKLDLGWTKSFKDNNAIIFNKVNELPEVKDGCSLITNISGNDILKDICENKRYLLIFVSYVNDKKMYLMGYFKDVKITRMPENKYNVFDIKFVKQNIKIEIPKITISNIRYYIGEKEEDIVLSKIVTENT